MAYRVWLAGCLAAGMLAPVAAADVTPGSGLIDPAALAKGDPIGFDLPVDSSTGAPAMSLAAVNAQPILADSISDESDVYSLPTPPGPGEGSNLGGVNLQLQFSDFNHYVYRGVDHSITSGATSTSANGTVTTTHEKTKATSLNLQADGKLIFDLGNFPHPFVGLFAEVYDADPLSRFQEIRPYYGVNWTVRPFILEGGGTTYIYPEREKLNTAEAYGKVTLDDSFLFNTDRPIFSPYAYGAYDYNKNNGWYFEVGVTHDLPLEDFGLTLTFNADVAYILGFQQQFVYINRKHDTGFQHYDVGMQAAYSLNRFFNISDRFGQFDLMGFLYYSGKINHDLNANDVLWGGAGIRFKY